MSSRSSTEALLQEQRLCSCSFKEIQVIKGNEKKGCGSISAKDLKIMIQKVEESGSFEVRKEINFFDVNSGRRYGHSISGRNEH